jgi:predicted DsbA family dithiol-disulfide isomerase
VESGQDKLQVEIWSDVMCPFCYIGKRKFETALEQFNHKDQVEVIWKSFQLSPDMKTEPGKSIHQYLSEHKGIPIQEAKQLNDRVTAMAAQVGLVYDLDHSVVANSFDAHRLLHAAQKAGVQQEAEEKVFAAYFTEGKNIADKETLIQLGQELGMDAGQLKSAFETNAFADEVEADVEEAQQLGIRGVPFFVFNRKYAISGAQDSETFLGALKRAFDDQ